MEMHKLPCEIRRHIVPNPIVECVDSNLALSMLRLKSQIEIQRFLRPQIWIAEPVIAEFSNAEIVGHTGVHLPVVVELPHPRLCIARTNIRLEAPIGMTSDRMRHPHVKADMRAK